MPKQPAIPLSESHLHLVAEWHPEKNYDLTPDDVVSGSMEKVWWKCPNGPDHEWEAAIYDRARKGTGCRFCRGQSVSITNSLAALYPDLAAEWHPTKNGDLTPDDVVAGSGRKVWWKCPNGPDHEWEAALSSRAGGGRGCRFCSGLEVSITNSLAALYPELVAEWHPEKNYDLTPNDVVAGSMKKVWWKCPNGPDHEWEAAVRSRTTASKGGHVCRFCAGREVSVTNSLAALYPVLVAEWHPTKNGDLTPDDVVAGSTKKVWWKCPNGPDHEWETTLHTRTSGGGRGCRFCRGLEVSITNSLAALYPDLVAEWHPTKNGDLTPDDVVAGSDKKVWWKCPNGSDHEWEAKVNDRAGGGRGCRFCRALGVSITNSLAALYPDLVAEWHPVKNGVLTPDEIVAGSGRKVWWKCPNGPDHEWEAAVSDRASGGHGCGFCNLGWTVQNVRLFVQSLLDGSPPPVEILSSADLYLIFLQKGLRAITGKSRDFIASLATGRFPPDELEKFVAEEPSLVDDFLDGTISSLEDFETGSGVSSIDSAELGVVDDDALTGSDQSNGQLPEVSAQGVLQSFDSDIFASVDEEAVDYFVASGVAKLWNQIYADEEGADDVAANVEAFVGEGYSERIRERFLSEYRSAKEFTIPTGYTFRPKGFDLVKPNLMQRHTASLVRDRRRVGNWSGTGAGKTLSAVLASRVIGASLTLICCPNSIVADGWAKAIKDIYPDSEVETKTWNPGWTGSSTYRYLVLNYEMFQLQTSPGNINRFLESQTPDFIVVDEIHFAKQTTPASMSHRREMVMAMITKSTEANPRLHVLGMSATPVINNLYEGRSMLEMVTSQEYRDLKVNPTVDNAMRVYQHLVRLGVRWMPNYPARLDEVRPEVDCTDYLDEIRGLSKGSVLPLEQILTRAKLPEILRCIKPKTLIYSMYIQGIDKILYDAITAKGWKVGFYTGDDKSGLDDFINGNVDVLIGTSAIGTGVDGLQSVCDQLIVNVMPWTAAEYEQLKGRIYRQGQTSDKVTVIIPTTYAKVGGERWSWCESKWRRVQFKKSMADAAVDGAVPEGHLRSPAQAYSDAMEWLDRLDRDGVYQTARAQIDSNLLDVEDDGYQSRAARYGDFSRMNQRWNGAKSGTTHTRLQENSEEWQHYHALYRDARKTWAVVPFEQIVKELSIREGYVVGDFGCGEALLAEKLGETCTVYSFDHVAMNDMVTACDIADVPIDDGELDVAVFCLSLMGTNFTDYLKEAHRTLKLDGRLHIYEATTRFGDRDQFAADLGRLGFGQVTVEDEWKFTHIVATKDSLTSRRLINNIGGLRGEPTSIVGTGAV